MPQDPTWRPLCARRDLSPDLPNRIERDGTGYAVFLLGDRPFVTEPFCTHGPGLLWDGDIEGEDIVCPFHQGRFHIPTGRPSGAPCTTPLRVFPACLIDDQVCIADAP